jgi:dihydrofolate reductase
MHQIVAVENVSVDGVMQSPGRPDEDTRGGFDRGGWATAHLAGDEVAAQAAMAGQGGTAALLFGTRTYRDLVGHWLSAPEPNPFADILRATTKYVASRDGATALDHPNSHLLAGEAADTVAELKQQGDGDIVLLGSGELLHTLQAADLVDRYVLTTIPVVLGTGIRLFAQPAAAADLELVRDVVSPAGAIVAEYRRR